MGAKTLETLIFIQGSRCFFCNQHLPQEKASIEHLLATSKGGTNTDDNRVACCKTINGILGNKSLKEKFDIVLKQKGNFCCPESSKGTVTPTLPAQPSAAYQRVLIGLRKQRKALPTSRATLESAIKNLLKPCPQTSAGEVIKQLQQGKMISIQDNKVTYSL